MPVATRCASASTAAQRAAWLPGAHASGTSVPSGRCIRAAMRRGASSSAAAACSRAAYASHTCVRMAPPARIRNGFASGDPPTRSTRQSPCLGVAKRAWPIETCPSLVSGAGGTGTCAADVDASHRSAAASTQSAAGRSHAAKSGNTKGRSSLRSSRSSVNSFRDGRSAMFAFDLTYSKKTSARRPTFNAWKALTIRPESIAVA